MKKADRRGPERGGRWRLESSNTVRLAIGHKFANSFLPVSIRHDLKPPIELVAVFVIFHTQKNPRHRGRTWPGLEPPQVCSGLPRVRVRTYPDTIVLEMSRYVLLVTFSFCACCSELGRVSGRVLAHYFSIEVVR